MKQVPKLGSLPASLGTTLWNILDSLSPSWCQWADVRLSTLQRPGSLDSSTAANRSNRPLPRQMKSNKAAKSTTYPSSPAESALRAIPKTHQNSYWEFLRGTESYSPSFQISLLERRSGFSKVSRLASTYGPVSSQWYLLPLVTKPLTSKSKGESQSQFWKGNLYRPSLLKPQDYKEPQAKESKLVTKA